MPDLKIEVPITVSGDKSSSDFGNKVADQIKRSLGSIGIGKSSGAGGGLAAGKGIGKMAGVLGAILVVLKSLDFVIKPVMSLLKAILVLLFVPLIPLLKPVLQLLQTFLKSVSKARKNAPQIGKTDTAIDIPIAVANWALMIGYAIGDFLAELGRSAFDIGKKLGSWLYNSVIKPAADWITKILDNISSFISDKIIALGEFFLGIGQWIWDFILSGLQFIVSLGSMIWDFLLKGLKFIANLGVKLWDWFKGALSGAANLGQKIWNWIKDNLNIFKKDDDDDSGKSYRTIRKNDFLMRPGKNAVSFSPDDTIIGVKNPGSLGGGTTININNPVVRNDQDIRLIANEVSRVLQRQTSGRFSS